MPTYLVTRLVNAVVTLFGLITLVFFLIHIIPGDPIEVLIGDIAHVTDKQALRTSLGLDQPILTQWYNYLHNLLHFNMGESLHSKKPVFNIILERLPATILLSLSSVMTAIIIAIPLGITAAVYQNTLWDRVAMGFSILGVAIPNFCMGPCLILLFSLWLGWFPVSGLNSPAHLILPSLTLGTALAGILARMVRTTILEILHEDYILAAAARGLSQCTILFQHALRNAALPILTVLSMQLGALLSGAVITEAIFSWPGIGQLMIEAIQKRDYPLLQGCMILIGAIYIFINLLTDLLYTFLDPRIRLEK